MKSTVTDAREPVDAAIPAIDLEALELSIGGNRLLDGVSLRVDSGQMVALIGANGAGKTTLLKCLLGLIRPDAGEIRVDGKRSKDYSRTALARKLAYVPQLLEASVPFTVLDFVMMGRYAHESGFVFEDEAAMRIAEQSLQRVNMESFAKRTLMTLSGGERQKVCVAAALAQQAPVLVLDEPSAHLDPRQQEEVHKLLTEIAREDGLSVLTVTHDLNWAAMDYDYLYGMKQGKMVVQGSPGEVMCQDSLRAVFGVDFSLMTHPESNVPIVIPSMRKERT